jgi:hypothetical protein
MRCFALRFVFALFLVFPLGEVVAVETASVPRTTSANRFEQERLRIDFTDMQGLKLARKSFPTYDELTADLPNARGSFALWTYSAKQHNVAELLGIVKSQEKIEGVVEKNVLKTGATGQFFRTKVTVEGKPVHVVRAVVQRDGLAWLYVVSIDAVNEVDATAMWNGFLDAKLL